MIGLRTKGGVAVLVKVVFIGTAWYCLAGSTLQTEVGHRKELGKDSPGLVNEGRVSSFPTTKVTLFYEVFLQSPSSHRVSKRKSWRLRLGLRLNH